MEQSLERISTFPNTSVSSNWKVSLHVALDYGCQLIYIYIYIYAITNQKYSYLNSYGKNKTNLWLTPWIHFQDECKKKYKGYQKISKYYMTFNQVKFRPDLSRFDYIRRLIWLSSWKKMDSGSSYFKETGNDHLTAEAIAEMPNCH